jgi:hypothetical protein
LLGPRAPQVYLGAFGKHPAWNDHIDPDIGLEGRLYDFKQLLYLNGIRDRAIPSWLKSDAEQLVPYGHVFAWQTNDDVLVGRLWYSRDGRSRDDFPMVVCAQCVGLPLSWALSNALPILERVEGSLQRTTDRQVAISFVEQGREDLRALARHATPEDGKSIDGRALTLLAESSEVGETGLLRVLHVLRESDFGQNSPTHAEHVRVPRCASTPAEGITLWSAALEASLGHAPSIFFLAPINQTWLDMLVGIPDPSQFLVIRGSLKLIPLTTDIAYTLDDDFSAKNRAMLIQARSLAAVR